MPEIISALFETFDHAVSYKGYQVYKYNGSFLSSDPEKIFCVNEWTIGDDGWYIDLRPQYMIFKDEDSPVLAGVMMCEFTPTGNKVSPDVLSPDAAELMYQICAHSKCRRSCPWTGKQDHTAF